MQFEPLMKYKRTDEVSQHFGCMKKGVIGYGDVGTVGSGWPFQRQRVDAASIFDPSPTQDTSQTQVANSFPLFLSLSLSLSASIHLSCPGTRQLDEWRSIMSAKQTLSVDLGDQIRSVDAQHRKSRHYPYTLSSPTFQLAGFTLARPSSGRTGPTTEDA